MESPTNSKVVPIALVCLLVAFITWMTTGWSHKVVNEYLVIRYAITYITAEHSKYDTMNVSTKNWFDPASQLRILTTINGNTEVDPDLVIKHEGKDYMAFAPLFDVDKTNFDRFEEHYEEKFLIDGEFGKKILFRNEYHKLLQLSLTGKPCHAEFHYGKFWGYSIPD